jgi:homoserine dehydrogenase
MEVHKQLSIGLFGFGVVGEGLFKILQQTPSLKAAISGIVIKNKDKKRSIPDEYFTTDKNTILHNDAINVIVEVTNDPDAAFDIVKEAMQRGKGVVSANKKMIAEHLPELLELQRQHDVPFLYEASTCASIPIIRNLEEYYDNDLLHSVSGIVNGSTNFILTKMFEEKLDYNKALLLAQQLGFAESDPRLDVEGVDAVNKLTILLVHAYGIVTHPESLVYSGIQHVTGFDAQVAQEKHCNIRLVAQARKLQDGRIASFLLPQLVPQTDQLYTVRNEFNAVAIESGFSEKQLFYGKGAGSFPTASAVLSDIAALRYDYRYEYKKLNHHTPGVLTNDFYLKIYVSFEALSHIPKEQFEWIEEWHSDQDRHYLVGIIHFEKLAADRWWKQHGISLIVCADGVIENVEIRKLKKRSLELAGLIV